MGAAQDMYERVRQCFNRHDLDGLRALTAGSTVIVRPTPGQIEEPDAIGSYFVKPVASQRRCN